MRPDLAGATEIDGERATHICGDSDAQSRDVGCAGGEVLAYLAPVM